jgi:hypothetical protein
MKDKKKNKGKDSSSFRYDDKVNTYKTSHKKGNPYRDKSKKKISYFDSW